VNEERKRGDIEGEALGFTRPVQEWLRDLLEVAGCITSAFQRFRFEDLADEALA